MFDIGDIVFYDEYICVVLGVLPLGRDFVLSLMTGSGETFTVPSLRCSATGENIGHMVEDLRRALKVSTE